MPSNARLSPFDGFPRSAASDAKISKDVAAALNTPSGKALMEYLRSISIQSVSGPGVDPNELMHREGQRFIVGILSRRLDHAEALKKGDAS